MPRMEKDRTGRRKDGSATRPEVSRAWPGYMCPLPRFVPRTLARGHTPRRIRRKAEKRPDVARCPGLYPTGVLCPHLCPEAAQKAKRPLGFPRSP